MKTFKDYVGKDQINESGSADLLNSSVKDLIKNLRAAEKYASMVGRHTKVMRDEKGIPYMRAARAASQNIQKALAELDNEWNGALK